MEKQMITKVLPFDVKEVAPRTLEFVGSTEDKDREGDIIMASGWQLKQYKRNPVFMWAHNYDDPPIGKATKVWANDGKLRFHVQFAEKEEYEFADTIYKLYKGGYLRASSVGFIPIESELLEVKEDEDNFFSHRPTRFLKQELLELSGCPVPANPNALAEARAKGLIKDFWKFMPETADAEKPYPNEHACRLKDLDDFQEGSFKRTEREHEGKMYSIIMGRLKDESTMTEQAYRYDKEVWAVAEARSHCKDHDGTFEAATTEASETDKQPYTCECIDCGHKLETDEHCKDIKCPKCGGEMRRVERPGPGRAEGATEEPEQRFEKLQKEISQANIGDELDYLGRAIKDVGLNAENVPLAWELTRIVFEGIEVTREPGSDIPVDIAEKIGAVLNKANRERLEKVKILAQEVLDSAEHAEEPDKSLSIEEIKETMRETMQEAIEQAQGKLRR